MNRQVFGNFSFRAALRAILRFGAIASLGLLCMTLLASQAKAADPCCFITAINQQTGIVTARVNATGQTFQFKVTNQALLKSLKVGQGVYANFQTQKVSVDGVAPCCSITSFAKAGGLSAGTAAADIRQAVNPLTPCCSITSIDSATGVVTAKVNATGALFQSKVANQAFLHSRNVGHGIYANFTTQKVSMDGGEVCCQIVSFGHVGGVGNTVAGQNLGNAANPGDICCGITNINVATGVVTARNNANGQSFRFKVSDANLLRSLKTGQGIYANFTTQKVSADGVDPCCDITSLGKAGRVGNPAAGHNVGNQVDPADPCCSITSINVATGVVTAKVNSSGQTFQFKLTNAALLKSLKTGQGVFANFGTQKVSVDGLQPCCNITTLGQSPKVPQAAKGTPGGKGAVLTGQGAKPQAI